ncbi:unnamed protein product [Didymodactylos carnosus]|uniref:Sulfatase N-terminal domain-containing protein n=1 Tax=Didymodactylos carnosus TaxID=1234261 RepID=A0A814ML12_9BILA|nr:unnamed protein product [Didymodactylos carnosus]CAF3846773.1 unnamed protein product [Didymodactylos carnosus]
MFCGSGKFGWGKANVKYKTHNIPCTAKDFIFNVFKANGYSTALISNMCVDYIGDYYGRTSAYHVDYESVMWSCHPEYDVDGQWNSVVGPYGVKRRCIDGRYVHSYQLDVIKDFVQKHDSKHLPYFSFVSFIEGHEPSMEVVGMVDQELSTLVQYLTSNELNQPPIILLVADHGLHYGPMFQQTTAGKMEWRLPILIAITPNQYLSDTTKQTLIENEYHLVTPRDLYWTLYNMATDSISKPLHTDDLRRPSLFHKLSFERDCVSEGIPQHLCACSQDGIKINPSLYVNETST